MANEHPEREQPGYYTNWIDESVRFHDLDAYNHVNNNVIGIYFETARMALLEKVQPKGWTTDAHFVLAKNTILFINELRYPNKIRIGQRLLRLGETSMTSCGGIFVENTCVALGETVSVWIGSETRRPEKIPADIRAALERS
ncbi:MAG: thioesterase family protein [Alphaproteobacteria bacterium]|nr:thioesterase family protein [Alphaproteobacteria bacterium]